MPYYHPDQFPPEFVERVEKAHAPRQYGETGFSASAVEAMTPEEHGFVLHHAASMQRGHPESVMNQLQRVAGGGVLSVLAEHVGDITHRLNKDGTVRAVEDVAPKVNRSLDILESRYGVHREHQENLQANRVDTEALDAVTQEYANAHRGLPTYNQPSDSAKYAAIMIGKGDFSSAAVHLRSLKRQMSDPDKFKYLMSQQGSVEFLREREERGY